MKLLIGYDGSAESDWALDELRRAGLPDEAEALVLTVAEIWLPSPGETTEERPGAPADETPAASRRAGKALSEARVFAKHAQKRLSSHFPNWKIETLTAKGSPAREIISEASRLKADLIVVGFSGRGGFFSLGSVSQKILSEADCSVRVSRRRADLEAPSRLLIGYDGSSGAEAAVEAVAARKWSEGTEVFLIAASDRVAPESIERFVAPIEKTARAESNDESLWIEKVSRPALEKLRAAGLSAALDVRAGNPKQVLVEEAARRGADAIFTGAKRCGSRFDKFLLGSVSAAVAARAKCSVEVVRAREKEG